jgi:probable addiction module antidote protein
MNSTRPFKDSLLEDLKDMDYAVTYLSVALEECEDDIGHQDFLLALRDVAEAQGGLSRLAGLTHLNRQSLYKALSEKGNPSFNTIGTVLHGLGLKLDIKKTSSSSFTNKPA